MAPDSRKDRRLACRYPLDTALEYSVLDSRQVKHVAMGWGLDISETGISFQPTEQLPGGQEIRLSIPWPWSPGMTDLRLTVTGRVLRSDDTRCAIQIQGYQYQIVADSDAVMTA